MSGRSSPRRIAMMAVALSVVLLQQATTQPSQRLARFEYDSTFVIGAYTVPGWASLARDMLKLDFTYHYAAPDVTTLDSMVNWKDTLARDLYYQTDRDTAEPLRTVFTPRALKELHGWVSVTDSYAETIADVQMLDFGQRSGTLEKVDVANDPDLLQTRWLPAATSGLLVGRPRYVNTYGFRRSDSTHYSVDTVYPFYDIGNGDPVKALDSSYKVRFGFHFSVDTLLGPSLPGTVIAYVKLWRRLPVDDVCRCAAYERFDSVPLTYGMYLDANYLPYPLDEFRDVGFWIDMRDSTEFGVIVDNVKYRATPGSWAGWNDTNAVSRARCSDSLAAWRAAGRVSADTVLLGSAVEESDVFYQFFTQGTAKIRFLRGRVAPHQFEALMNGRLARFIEPEIRDLLAPDSTNPHFASLDSIRRRLWRIAVYDEPGTASYPAHTFLVDTLLDLIEHYSDSATWPGLFQDPVGNYDGFRRLQFDLDTSRRTRVHMMSRQLLPMFDGPIPVFYVRPDKMNRPGVDTSLWRRYYPTDSGGLVAPNSPAGYKRYTDSIQVELGRFGDYPTVQTHTRIIPTLARMVAVSKIKYADRIRDSVPVYNVVTVNGRFNASNGVLQPGWDFSIRPKTPEEIAVQCFVSLNTGCQGINFDELSYDGVNLGIADYRYGIGRVDWSETCDTAIASALDSTWHECDRGEWDWANPPKLDISAPRDTLSGTPHMWLGLRSRFLATKRVIEELRRIAPTYERLYYRMEQMSVHDDRQSFDEIPMVGNLRMEQADTARRDVFARYPDSAHVDARIRTYAEVTHFYPGTRDVAGVAANARYIAVANRRTFPIDHAYYGTRTTSLDSTSRDRGFGFIDVRRPLITLKNSTTVMADSFLVEKVGHEDSLHWRVKTGVEFALDWLEPGWGGLYRITPIGGGISLEGTAYNNAVHSENPSRLGATKDRIAVYERDSIVYLRALDSTGTWGSEIRISDATDSVDATPALLWWQRPAANFHPAVATVRDTAGTSCMIVWERLVAPSSVTVEARLLKTLPRVGVDTLPENIRFRIASTRPLLPRSAAHPSGGGTAHAPAVVGIDSGYVVAYPSTGPGKGISVTLVRDMIRSSMSVQTKDTLTKDNIKWPSTQVPIISDSAYFPTLAHRRHRAEFQQRDGHWICLVGSEEPPQDSGTHSGLIVHLAYQQGLLDTASSQFIMYNMIACRVGTPGEKPILWVSPTEHASAGLPGCGFLHPSIAADSISVGVAFQAHSSAARRPVLRFRRSDSAASSYAHWTTRTYAWGGTSEYHEWPSLTMFPAATTDELLGINGSLPRRKGVVVWYRTNAPSNVATQHMYRFGMAQTAHLPNGVFPTMTLLSKLGSAFYEASSVLYRGDTTRLDSTRPRPAGTRGWYYPALLENGPLAPSAYFTASAAELNSTVMAGSDLIREVPYFGDCSNLDVVSMGIRTPVKPGPGGDPETDANVPGLPPSFFATSINGDEAVETLADGERITRTAMFESGPIPAVIERHVSRANDAVAWLNTQPYDSGAMSQADVRVVTELVRVSDSTVIWSDDTISVRAMSTDTLESEVELPTHMLTPGTEVFARVRMLPTAAMEYALSGGFAWEPTSGSYSAKVERWTSRGAPAAMTPDANMTLLVVPNPAHGSATLLLETHGAAEINVSLVDALGRVVRHYPTLSAARAGQYSLPIALDGIPHGLYLVRAESDGVASASKTLIVAP